MINGLIRPQSGSIYLFDEPIRYDNIYRQRLQVGYAVQQIGLFPHLTVYKNISLPGLLAKWTTSQREERVLELMKLVSLPWAYRSKYPHQLSGGEQQRVGLCRAIMLNPPVMLLDEAFSSLDAETKEEIHNELLHLQEAEPRCIVLVTHDPAEAKKLGSKQLHLNDGIISDLEP